MSSKPYPVDANTGDLLDSVPYHQRKPVPGLFDYHSWDRLTGAKSGKAVWKENEPFKARMFFVQQAYGIFYWRRESDNSVWIMRVREVGSLLEQSALKLAGDGEPAYLEGVFDVAHRSGAYGLRWLAHEYPTEA